MKKICVFVGSRANYSSIKSVMRSVKNHPELTLQLVVGASALLDRFGEVVNLIRKDGFEPDYTFHNIVEGNNPTTMSKSTGLAMIEMAMVLDNLKPDYVVIVGDRFEMIGITLSTAFMNVRVAHTMGGEVTGTIDESIRHAITKMAHLHFPANQDSKDRIIKMGEDAKTVFNVGCPRLDLVAEELKKNSIEELKHFEETTSPGVGMKSLDFSKPFLLVSQHPVTTEFGQNKNQMMQTLEALAELSMPTILLWPNVDAGSDEVSSAIRTFRELHNPSWLAVYKNLPTNIYIHLMNTTSCLVGNSSSGVREGAFIGTPVVNIGTRQHMRLRGENVIDCGYSAESIFSSIQTQISKRKYPSSTIYGDGNAGEKVANILATENPAIQKVICY